MWAGMGAADEQRLGYYRILEQDPKHSRIDFVVTEKMFDFSGSNESVQAVYGQAWALTHFLTGRYLPELMKFCKMMAMDDFDTPRDEAWRQKTFETFRECMGDLDALEIQWRR